jgi:hypothetical protein
MTDRKAEIRRGTRADERLSVTSRHVHDYSGVTMDSGAGVSTHDHQFSGSTDIPIMVGDGKHVHHYNNNTTADRNHIHVMEGTTGVNIDISGGGHIHVAKGRTSTKMDHTHDYELSTSIVIKPKRKKY